MSAGRQRRRGLNTQDVGRLALMMIVGLSEGCAIVADESFSLKAVVRLRLVSCRDSVKQGVQLVEDDTLKS